MKNLPFAGMVLFFLTVSPVRSDLIITPTGSTNNPATNPTLLTFTTGLGGMVLTGVGVKTFASPESSTATLRFNDGTTNTDLSFSYTANNVYGTEHNWTSGSLTLLAGKTYTVTLQAGTLSDFADMGANTYDITTGLTDYITSANKSTNNSAALALYYNPASVPEPSTLVLSMIVGLGAIGYRRLRK